jgi:bacillithiol synthase
VKVLATPLADARAGGSLDRAIAAQRGRRFPAAAAGALIAGPGAAPNRDRLLAGGCLAVTTGQQAGVFTGPLFTIYKALTAATFAAELAQRLGVPVVPVHWVAGDDHDFAEVDHCAVIADDGTPRQIVLRHRAPDGPLTPVFREPVGREGVAALDALAAALPPGNGRDDAIAWLARAYTPEQSLAEAHAVALADLLDPFGVVVCRGWHGALKRAAQPVVLGALEQAGPLDAALAREAERLRAAGREVPIEVGGGLSLVMIEAKGGRDRLRMDGAAGRFTTRRSGEAFDLSAVRELAEREAERVSAGALLRGAVEAFVFPTVAYAGGPGEQAYLAQSGPVYELLGVPRPAVVPRFSALIVEDKVRKVLEAFELEPASLRRSEPEIGAALARDALDPAAAAAFAGLRRDLEARYAELSRHAVAVDPTLELTALGYRNKALAGARDFEKKLLAHLRKRQEVALSQILRARSQLFPGGKHQERVITVASVLARHGRGVLETLCESARSASRGSLEALMARS